MVSQILTTFGTHIKAHEENWLITIWTLSLGSPIYPFSEQNCNHGQPFHTNRLHSLTEFYPVLYFILRPGLEAPTFAYEVYRANQVTTTEALYSLVIPIIHVRIEQSPVIILLGRALVLSLPVALIVGHHGLRYRVFTT